ncbi:hypothetical protein ISS42_00775 [Candidatus Shapirobacteria bacterium]|nr:hypothetical protein [Candidatus Shapirobacteria bacterium]
MKQSIYSQRTQISLSPQLRSLIEAERILTKESLSQYLRKAAVLRMVLDMVERSDLDLIAEAVIGSVSKSKSGWKKVADIKSWQRKQRKDENRHRS